MPWTTAQAADAAGMTPAAFRRAAARARAAGVELRTDAGTWPDRRTPLYDEDLVLDHLAARPGKGAGGGRPRKAADPAAS